MATQEDILSKAQQRNQVRMAAVQSLIAAGAPVVEARAALEKAERGYARLYADALKVWTEEELKAVGVESPTRQAPGRPRRRSTRDRVADGELGVGALLSAQARREAEASVALDRDQTHAVGEPAA